MAYLGLTKAGTGFSLIAALMALDLAAWADDHKSVALLAAAGLCLDAAIQMCLVLSLRSIYMLEPSERGRLNGLFMAWMFGCGAMTASCFAQPWTDLTDAPSAKSNAERQCNKSALLRTGRSPFPLAWLTVDPYRAFVREKAVLHLMIEIVRAVTLNERCWWWPSLREFERGRSSVR
jgi:hypothetical protein